MKVKLRLLLRADGRVSAVYSDKLAQPLPAKIDAIHRISNVKFDVTQQEWVSRDIAGNILATDILRDVCVDKEHQVLSGRLASLV